MAAHRVLQDVHKANAYFYIADPGNAGTIGGVKGVERSPATCPLTSTGAETRTLGRPTAAGDQITIFGQVVGGTITVTVTGGYDTAGDTTFTITAAKQWYRFGSVYDGTSYFWRMIGSYTTAEALTSGGAAFTGRVTTTDGVSGGTAKVVGGLAYSNTAASTAIASTSAETVFDTNYTIPANTLKAGTVVKVRFQGIQTTEVGTDTMAFKFYIGGSGGTALITSAAATGANNSTFQGECTIICRTAGTTGTFVSTATYKQLSAEGTMTVKDDITGSTTINTTANQLLTCTATFNTTNANSVRMDVFTVEIY